MTNSPRLHPLITLARLSAAEAMRHDSPATQACIRGIHRLVDPVSNRLDQCIGHAIFELGFQQLGLWVEVEADEARERK